jgi:MoaA/NifB/PqqE/SkfB family radical SAM enzyme
MSNNPLTENLKSFGVKQLVAFADSNPDKHIPMILDWAEKFDKKKVATNAISAVRVAMNDKESNWYKLATSIYTEIDANVRKTFIENFVANLVIKGNQRQLEAKNKYKCNIPWAILMDPTSACNLHCIGCWAADYGKKLFMRYETLDSIIQQGKKLGTFAYLYSGGEPLLRKDDLIRLCKKHSDCVFLAFTNGTLVDESFADDLLEVKNLVLAISVEGFEAETDFRRGKGTYRKVINAMDILRKKKLPFGVSCCYTSKNTSVIGSEAFFDEMINRGAKFAWFFTYVPVGVDASPELMVNPEQREFMYHQLRKFRHTKSLFTMDFWNDGEYVQGCIAGGKSYLHINANGNIEPCAFIHYADSNIYEQTLLEAYKAPLFMQYRQNQPFNQNHLRPCPLLDNPERLAEMVKVSGAKSTEMLHPEDVDKLCAKCKSASKNWAITAERLWTESGHGEISSLQGNSVKEDSNQNIRNKTSSHI